MIDQINAVKLQGYKPFIFIDDWFNALTSCAFELRIVKRQAKQIGVTVLYSNTASVLNKVTKAYVFRYGQLPIDTNAMVLRKKGVVISSGLKVNVEEEVD